MKDLDVHLSPAEPAQRKKTGAADVLAMFKRVRAKQAGQEKGDGVQ